MSFSITPLLTGVRAPGQGVMTCQQGCGRRIWLPIRAFLRQESHPFDYRYDDSFIDGISYTELQGDNEILPGLQTLHMPGHTDGTLSVAVDTAETEVIITGFCCNNKNFSVNGPAVCRGVHPDTVAAWESIRNVKAMGIKIMPTNELSLLPIAS